MKSFRGSPRFKDYRESPLEVFEYIKKSMIEVHSYGKWPYFLEEQDQRRLSHFVIVWYNEQSKNDILLWQSRNLEEAIWMFIDLVARSRLEED